MTDENDVRERILVVDDDQPVLELVEAMLHEEYDVDLAAEGDSALELCKKHQYQAIILDIALPGRNGFQLMGDLRERAPAAKIIMITGLSLSEEDRRKALEVADALLTKPFDVEEMKDLLRKDLRLEHLPHGT